MNRFEEENPTVRWMPGFARRWFGLTNEDPRRSINARYQWMPDWLKRLLNLDDAPVPYSGEAEPAAPSRSSYGYTPPPRSYTPGAPSFKPGAASYTPGAPSFTPRSFAPAAYQPASEESPSTPARLSLAGDELPPDVQPIGYLLRSYARGALPPQGLEAFTREARTTTEKVLNFYGHWIRFQTEEFVRIGSDLFNAAIDALPGEKTKQQPQTIRRIKVVADNGNGNGHGHGSYQAPVTPPEPPSATLPPADEPAAGSEDKDKE
ncbi:hypothetical protein [Chloroflexus islandicus]|uniref:hypothetical protein n=1 Tax=Chloroflexus islandicus TaxID=1707952 RepID=UPI000B05AE2B|nr:hypothetical protein [Chloroflexus islandicus]